MLPYPIYRDVNALFQGIRSGTRHIAGCRHVVIHRSEKITKAEGRKRGVREAHSFEKVSGVSQRLQHSHWNLSNRRCPKGLPNQLSEFQNVHVSVIGDIKSADRKSTRLNSSHLGISYAVFCL